MTSIVRTLLLCIASGCCIIVSLMTATNVNHLVFTISYGGVWWWEVDYLFRMTITSMSCLSNQLQPHIQQQNTRCRLVILVVVRVWGTLSKLVQGSSMRLCLEMCTKWTSMVPSIIYNTCGAINLVLCLKVKYSKNIVNNFSIFNDSVSIKTFQEYYWNE